MIDSLQQDYRQCACYAEYGGYARTGRVLWEASTGHGLGVRNWQLVPYKPLAVDAEVIPNGSVLYIADTVGVAYIDPQGDLVLHDGYFFTGDTGRGIRGHHLDVFLGTHSTNPFPFITSRPAGTFEAIVVTDPALPGPSWAKQRSFVLLTGQAAGLYPDTRRTNARPPVSTRPTFV